MRSLPLPWHGLCETPLLSRLSTPGGRLPRNIAVASIPSSFSLRSPTSITFPRLRQLAVIIAPFGALVVAPVVVLGRVSTTPPSRYHTLFSVFLFTSGLLASASAAPARARAWSSNHLSAAPDVPILRSRRVSSLPFPLTLTNPSLFPVPCGMSSEEGDQLHTADSIVLVKWKDNQYYYAKVL